MKVRLHLDTYADIGNGTFTIEATCWRSFEIGKAETPRRETHCSAKPNDAPTPNEILALYKGLYQGHDVAPAESAT